MIFIPLNYNKNNKNNYKYKIIGKIYKLIDKRFFVYTSFESDFIDINYFIS
jgi:hypothetical protein